ncbi:MAG: CDP-alcohol phosphatidyltransferase family protein [Lentisphaeria bacterium]|nr:CDP-alcohol phosphatidyltransferase family protein [Candidatus Neomarinimicrobiota bacterium]MCF7842465.1 CDP-alcohol phosphatidyltransferase family protein [Lentisphaeria bacterium]
MQGISLNPGKLVAADELPGTLIRELVVIRRIGWLVLVAGYFVMGLTWYWGAANQWVLQTGILWWFVYYQLVRKIDKNRAAADAQLYDTLGWGNRLTLVRGGLIAIVGGFVFQNWSAGIWGWIPGIFYTLAAIIDRVDGYVARKTRQVSLLGRELDTVFDALGLAVAPLLAVWYGQVHWSYLSVSLAYYLFQWGLKRRRDRNLPVYPLPPSFLRRALAGFQMGYIAVVLWPVFQPPSTQIAGVAFMIPVLIGFCVDWLLATGRLSISSPIRRRITLFGETIFLPALRLLLIWQLGVIAERVDYVLIPGESVSFTSILFGYTFLILAGMILVGVAGRIGALALIGFMGWHYLSHPILLSDYLAIFSLVWLLLLGTGKFSLWQWDEDWVNRYDGT